MLVLIALCGSDGVAVTAARRSNTEPSEQRGAIALPKGFGRSFNPITIMQGTFLVIDIF